MSATNAWINALQQLDDVAARIELEPHIHARLRQPLRRWKSPFPLPWTPGAKKFLPVFACSTTWRAARPKAECAFRSPWTRTKSNEISRRVAEQAVAHPWLIRCAPEASLSEVVRLALSRQLNVVGLQGEALREAIAARAQEHPNATPGLEPQDVKAMASFLEHDDRSLGEMAGLIARVSATQSVPALWVIDELHSAQTLAGLEQLRERVGQKLEGVVVLTHPRSPLALALRARGQARHLLAPLPVELMEELADSLIGLAPETRQRALESADGRPGFLVELLRGWLTGDRLVETEHGMELAALGRVMPKDGAQLWRERLGSLGPELLDRALNVLAQVICLGEPASLERLATMSREFDERLDEQALDALTRAGLLERDGESVRTTSTPMREAIIDELDRGGQLEPYYRARAALLEREAGAGRSLEFIARSWLDAGEAQRALDTACGRYELSLLWLDGYVLRERAELIARASAQLDLDARRDQRWVLSCSARALLPGLDPGDALSERVARLDEAIAVAMQREWREVFARALHARAAIYRDTEGELERARACYGEAIAIDRALGHKDRLAAHYYQLGLLLHRHGDHANALSAMQRARAARPTETPEFDVVLRGAIAKLWLEMNDAQTAMKLGLEALEFARKLGRRTIEAHCLAGQGEIVRYLDQPEQAAEFYEQARELYRLAGSQSMILETSVKLCLAELGMQRWERAAAQLQSATPEHALELPLVLSMIRDLAHVAAHLEERGWAQSSAATQRALRHIAQSVFVDRDLAWLTTHLLERARDAPEPLKRALLRVATKQWIGLGQPLRAKDLELPR